MATADDVRCLALSLPSTIENTHSGKPSFRIGNKIFAVIQNDGTSIVVKTTPEDREAYTAMDPETFSIPKGFETFNFMLVNLNRIDLYDLKSLLIQSWRLVASKRLNAEYEANLSKRL